MKYLLLILCLPFTAKTQITTAIMKANFGVDADLRSNYFNGALNGAGDDWYNMSAGSGEGIIDTTGAAAIVAGYTSNVSTRTRTFSRLMKQNPFSLLSNRLLIDAVFHRDYHGSDSTIFAAGSNKNGMSPVNWSCPVSQNIPDKNDLLDVFTHVRRAGPNITDSLWMFGGLSIESTTGNRYFDFELYQTDFYYDRATRTFRNYGPDAGHTSWTFDASGRIITAGDIIFSGEYSSSSLTNVEARIWVNIASLEISPAQFNWGGQFDGANSGATYGYASIVPKSSGAFYTGLQSVNGVWAGPFSLVLGDNSLTTTYTARQFMEFSVNMTKLGLDPAAYSANPCGSPFRRVLIKTRASTSFSAELKDFVAPFRMFDYPVVDAWADVIYYCGSMPTVPLTVINPNNASVYTWSTSNGNIVGSNTGPNISVNAPGTYYVNHQLHSSCPVYSVDSIKILYDPVCLVLNLQVSDFKAQQLNDAISLQWKIKNNENAKTIQIEYSTDGILFHGVSAIPANSHSGYESYSFRYNGYHQLPRVLYYRIRVTDKNGNDHFSQVVKIGNQEKLFEVFPNPTHGEAWITVLAGNTISYTISDELGKVLYKSPVIKTTKNTLLVEKTRDLSAGIYYITITNYNNKQTTTSKLIIQKG